MSNSFIKIDFLQNNKTTDQTLVMDKRSHLKLGV